MNSISAAIELAVKAVIEKESNLVVDAAIAALEKAIPGDIDDKALEAAKADMEAAVKAALMKLADKISADV